ncbi:hypothetical protein K469DRAFT_654226 [Zopfia rhizophila CBS 207.26]|uniref:UBC core domain-containing protein n=1 Tax=Zopfia rhizophila CBS 207.26 TaxID=1314779 RepID=A0A6A6EN27_9PEZI|nr:hypothetical protein K469DRAFT_654226 [Zopfia rhizophila CBS 207.26]
MQLNAELNGDMASVIAATTTQLPIQSEVPTRAAGKHDYRAQHSHSQPHSSSSRSFATVNDFASYIQTRKCFGCSTRLIQSQKDIEDLFKGWLTGQGIFTSLLKCKRCSTSTCVGCSSKSTGKKAAFEVTVQGTQITWCCGRGRLFLIFVILCGYDVNFCMEKQREAAKRPNVPRVGGSGIGFGGARGSPLYELNMMMPFSRGGRYAQGVQAPDPGKIRAQNSQQASDTFNRMVLSFLEELLPSLENKSNFDRTPPEAVTSMLLNCKILNKAAELLRNDSLEDATKRKDIYQALLSFLRRIGTHPITAQKTVFSERVVRDDTVNLLTLSFQSGGYGKAKEDKMSSLADSLRNLNIQSNVMLSGAQRNENEFRTTEGQNMLGMCRSISDLSEYLLANTQAGTGKGGKAPAIENAECGIEEVPDNQLLSGHYFGGIASAWSHSPPGRMKRLITEITSLKTGLPPGIFVRYGSSRLDVMKILIVGPSDTPYELGLFEFDLICPINYPNEPPKMNFRTTGGGSVRFNPNLYADGKVCLSLLGTWHGEPWRPAESTILQCLISIQAMILCEEPFYNEPGSENAASTAASRAYNLSVRKENVRWAILNWLETPVNPIWNDIVAQHFRKNANKILEIVMRWESEDTGGPYTPCPRMVRPIVRGGSSGTIATLRPRLQAQLQKYGVTAAVQPPGQAFPQQYRAQGHGATMGNQGSYESQYPPSRGAYGRGGYGSCGGYGGGRGGYGGGRGYY